MTLSIADIIVKNHILNYPLIFKDRLSVLSHILLRDPDSHWNEDGIIVSHNISNEDNPNAKLNWEFINQNYSSINNDQIPDIFTVHAQMAISQYQIIEKNIDVISSSIHFDQKLNEGDLTTISTYARKAMEKIWLAVINKS